MAKKKKVEEEDSDDEVFHVGECCIALPHIGF